MSNLPKLDTDGLILVRHLFHYQGARIFNTQQARHAADVLGIAQNTLNVVLSRLAKKGIIYRLRRGLYASIGLLGEMQNIHPFVISAYLVQPSAISHWSALQYHGLTEQLPSTVTASTPLRVYTPSMRKPYLKEHDSKHAWIIDDVRYEYIMVQKAHFDIGISRIQMDPYFVVQITDKERTLIDVFVYNKMFGGMGEALGILEEALGDIDVERLVEYILQYDEKTLAKRMGWALESFGIDIQYLKPLLDIPLTYYCLLEPAEPAFGPHNKLWMIQNNLIKGDINENTR